VTTISPGIGEEAKTTGVLELKSNIYGGTPVSHMNKSFGGSVTISGSTLIQTCSVYSHPKSSVTL
jgi:hypothetical protein